MMNANDVIETYVTDVAVLLPRKQRADVAFELRALIHEELQAKAAAAGRSVDAELATEFLRAFGRPADVAARYRPTLTIIDPADGHRFLRATVIGLAVIWSLGLIGHLWRPIASGSDLLHALGQWWGTTVIPSLWWPGVLVVGFGVAAWRRQRWPSAGEWTPRPSDRIHGSRASLVFGLLGIACGLFVLLDPRWLLDTFSGGRAAPAAYDALTYTEAFRERQAPWLFTLVALNVPLLLAVLVHGRWSTALRRMNVGLSLVTCAAMLWAALDGPAFIGEASDRAFKLSLVVIVGFTLAKLAIEHHRRIRPTPDRPLRQA